MLKVHNKEHLLVFVLLLAAVSKTEVSKIILPVMFLLLGF